MRRKNFTSQNGSLAKDWKKPFFDAWLASLFQKKRIFPILDEAPVLARKFFSTNLLCM